MPSLTQQDLAALAEFDTPTICNALEVVAPERRALGFNRRPLVCPFPSLKPVVAYARSATIRSREPQQRSAADARALRLAYYEYIGQAPLPSLAVIQDIDGPDAGLGAFWGEVQTNVHKALGCLGTVTNGSIRDIAQVAEGFQMLAGSIGPSHAYVHVVEFGIPVTIHGMEVMSGDLIHADRHGAVVVPADKIDAMKTALDGLMKQEARIIAAARAPGATVETIKAAFRG
jgi:regulator of RNase E activity RraA